MEKKELVDAIVEALNVVTGEEEIRNKMNMVWLLVDEHNKQLNEKYEKDFEQKDFEPIKFKMVRYKTTIKRYIIGTCDAELTWVNDEKIEIIHTYQDGSILVKIVERIEEMEE